MANKGARSARYQRLHGPDTAVSAFILEQMLRALLRRARLDRKHDIPYLAGYSRDGRTVYIDRELPRYFVSRRTRIYTDRFLILHETVEKAMIDQVGLKYQHAHQIALRTEEAAVRAYGISWREYDRFMQRYIKEVADESLKRLPLDLDIKPYRDEHDYGLLHRMQRAQRRERLQLRQRPKKR
ncbi:MAG: hypothetical protein KGJ56_04970 [Gammaproteobacteria bacterium]|nr:hypothetical protein [Gammaproteobacteria bacterium]